MTLYGEAGIDLLAGVSGDDTLTGGDGHDTFHFSLHGGADQITYFGTEVVDGHTTDQLDVTELRNPDGSALKSFDVSVTDDGRGNALLQFPGGESVVLVGVSPATVATPGMLAEMEVACFSSGNRIATPFGPRKVEELSQGDLILTLQASARILWHGQRSLNAAGLRDQPGLRPIRLKAGHFGLHSDLIVSPQHGIRLGDALIRARHLAGYAKGAHVARGLAQVTYHYLLQPRRALLQDEAAWVESFYPGAAIAALLWQDRVTLARMIGKRANPGTAGRIAADTLAIDYGPRCLPQLKGRAVRSVLLQSAGEIVQNGGPSLA